jgi:hypothetical protein
MIDSKNSGHPVSALEWTSIPTGCLSSTSNPEVADQVALAILQSDDMLQDQPRDGQGYWPVVAWQPSTAASHQTISLFTDGEWIWSVVFPAA